MKIVSSDSIFPGASVCARFGVHSASPGWPASSFARLHRAEQDKKHQGCFKTFSVVQRVKHSATGSSYAKWRFLISYPQRHIEKKKRRK
jgi:hypothetical protein